MPNVQAVGLAGWTLVIVASLVYADFALTALEERQFPLRPALSSLVFGGIAAAYIWRRRGRSGWVGFGLGLSAGILISLVLMVARGAVRAS